MPGPVPNRTSDLSRERDANRGDRMEVRTGQLRSTTIPEVNEDWHDIAKMVWEGCVTSGQADWYQNSDWALLYSLCDDLSRYKQPAYVKEDGTEVYKPNGQILATIYSSLSDLLVSEGARRRLRVELTAPEPGGPSEADGVMAGYRSGLRLLPPLPVTEF